MTSEVEAARARAIDRIELSMRPACQALASEGALSEKITIELEGTRFDLTWESSPTGKGSIVPAKHKGKQRSIADYELTAQHLLTITLKANAHSRAIIERVQSVKATREESHRRRLLEAKAEIDSFDAIACGHKDCEENEQLAAECMQRRIDEARMPLEDLKKGSG